MFNQEVRHHQVSLDSAEPSADRPSHREEHGARAWVGQPVSWGEAFIGALPFLLFGLAFLLDGLAELNGQELPVIHVLGGNRDLPALTLTVEMGVYLACALGLFLGVWQGFPRWSYAYLGMCLYFGWIYNNQFYYGLLYEWWTWLPLLTAVFLGMLLARSLQPLAGLFQGVWNDWTRLSFALYAFAVPMFTLVFFEDDWGVFHLYGLFFDTVLLAAGAVAYLRARTIWGRVFSLQAAVLVLVVKGILQGWGPTSGGQLRLVSWSLMFIITSLGIFLLPAVVGLLRWGVETVSAR